MLLETKSNSISTWKILNYVCDKEINKKEGGKIVPQTMMELFWKVAQLI